MENTEKIKVLICGCNGAMGQIVAKLVNETNDMEVIAGFDKAARELPDFAVVEDINDLYGLDLHPDVIIDFSAPACTLTTLEYAVKNNIPTVVATTGFNNEEQKKIGEYSRDIPVFWSSNMSYTVNLMKKVLYEISPKLGNFDIEISETHHNRKKDAPSGTAKMLAEAIKNAFNGKRRIVSNRTGKREDDEIGISSMRGGNVFGEHTVHFFGDKESFEIKHTAFSREIFAEGAIKAARFIVGKGPGMYNMNHLM